MVSPQLLQYVRAQRAAGISKEEIIKALAGGGWSAADAQEAFAAIEAPAASPMAPKPPPPPTAVAPKPPLGQASLGGTSRPAPVSAPQPVSVRPQPAAVVQPRSAYAPQPKKRAKWPWVLLGLLLFFILGAGAGAYVTVTNGWVSSFVSSLAGVAPMQPVEEEQEEAVEEQGGAFLEVVEEPLDLLDQEGATSTPATSTATSTGQ